MLGTDAGRKIYFGKHKADAWIQSGSGNAMFAGTLEVKKSIMVEALGQKLRVGEYAGMPGLYSSDDGPRDMIIGVADGNKVYVGKDNKDSYFTAGTGNLWLKGTLETHGNNFIYSEGQRLRVGSVVGIPGIYSSDGAARDLMLGVDEVVAVRLEGSLEPKVASARGEIRVFVILTDIDLVAISDTDDHVPRTVV